MSKKVTYLGREDLYSKEGATGKRYRFDANKFVDVEDEDLPSFEGGNFVIEDAEKPKVEPKKKQSKIRRRG